MATLQSHLPAGAPTVPVCFGGTQPWIPQTRRPRDTHVSELHQALLAKRAQTLVGRAGLQEELRQAHALAAEEGAHGGAASFSLLGPRTRTMGLPLRCHRGRRSAAATATRHATPTAAAGSGSAPGNRPPQNDQ